MGPDFPVKVLRMRVGAFSVKKDPTLIRFRAFLSRNAVT